MKKICVMTSVHPRTDTRIVSHESASLAAHGYDVALLCADGNPDETVYGVNIHSVVAAPISGRIRRMTAGARIMYNAARLADADVYHFHDPELIPVAMKLARRGKKVIYDVHEDVPETVLEKGWIPRFLRGFVSRSIRALENRCAKKCAAVITVTPHIYQRFSALNSRCVTVSNFPSIDDFRDNSAFSERRREACYIGARLDESRGVKEMAKAAITGKFTLHLFGRFEPEELQNEILREDADGRIICHGYAPKDELAKVMNSCTVGLVTEHPTGNAVNAYCTKMFEYMANAIPVVSSDIPLWKDIVEADDCGICVDCFSPDEIASAVDRLMDDRALAEKMGRNGRQAVEKKYNWANEERKLLELYAAM